jgi:hypothetical protein
MAEQALLGEHVYIKGVVLYSSADYRSMSLAASFPPRRPDKEDHDARGAG